jgi:uncharacterized Tic20 family protein
MGQGNYPDRNPFTDQPPTAEPPTVQPTTELTSEEKQWAMFCHLSALVTGFLAGMSFLGPLIIWLIKKDQSKFVDYHGKEALNFQLNVMLYVVVGIATICLVVGIFILIAVGLYSLIMAIIAGVKAGSGEYYRYPLTLRMIN